MLRNKAGMCLTTTAGSRLKVDGRLEMQFQTVVEARLDNLSPA